MNLPNILKTKSGITFTAADWAIGLNVRETGLIEHICEHGVGHPDPRSAVYLDHKHNHRPGTWSVHGCDGCCSKGFSGT